MLWLLLLPRERRYLLTFCRRKGYAQGRQHLPLISRVLRQFRHGCFLVDLVLQQAQSAPCPQPIQLCKELSDDTECDVVHPLEPTHLATRSARSRVVDAGDVPVMVLYFPVVSPLGIFLGLPGTCAGVPFSAVVFEVRGDIILTR